MFSWLKSKMQNSRICMCIKEVKWDLDQRDLSQIAQILIVAQNLRCGIFKGDEEIRKILDNPFIASRNDLMELYNVLENTRNSSEYQLKQVKQFVGEENFPNFSQEQFTIAKRGLEIWMCTLGAAISPNRREDVKDMWQKLISSKHMIPEALEKLKKRENQTKELLGFDEPGIFDFLEIDEIQEMCKFVPTVFN